MPPPVTPAGCRDGFTDEFETDGDCGGPDCERCEPGRACLVDGDCVVGRCVDARCVDDAPDCMTDEDCDDDALCLAAPSGRRTCRPSCVSSADACAPGLACYVMSVDRAGCVPAPNASSRWEFVEISATRDPAVSCPVSLETTFPDGRRGLSLVLLSPVTSIQPLAIASFDDDEDATATFLPLPVTLETKHLAELTAGVMLTLGERDCFQNGAPECASEALDLRPRWAGESATIAWTKTRPRGPVDFLLGLEFKLAPVPRP